MKLQDVASSVVISVGAKAPHTRALALMEEHQIHHLPVESEGKLVGMVSDRDLLLAAGFRADKKEPLLRVEAIMSQPVSFLSPRDSLRTAARLMIERQIHALPLVDEGRLCGIVTASDLLQGLIAAPEFENMTQPLLLQPILAIMGVQVTTVEPRATLEEVVTVMHNKKMRHLPVVVAGELLGIISDRDVRRALGEASGRDAKAQESGAFFVEPGRALDIMTKEVATISPAASVGQAADELLSRRIHCLPVLEEGKLIGIVTDTDILRAIGACAASG